MAMSEKINIAHLIGSLRIGGAERQVVSILGLLPGESFNRHVIVLNDTPGGFVAQLDEGVSYYSLEYRRRYLPFCLARLIKYLRCHRIEVLHCHMYHASIIGALAATVARTPVVVTTEHGRNPWKKRYHHWLEEKIISPAVQRICRYTPKDLTGNSFMRFIHPDDLPGLMQSFRRTLSGTNEPHEFRVIDKDGSLFYVQTSSRPFEAAPRASW